jgi:hypothetical protein
LSHKNDYNHGEKVDNVAAVVARVACKRKAASDFGERPSKIIRQQLVNVDTAEADELSKRDITTSELLRKVRDNTNTDVYQVIC